MLREKTPGQSILYLYEPGTYAPLARVDQVEGEGQKLYYFHTDQIGTPLEFTKGPVQTSLHPNQKGRFEKLQSTSC